ncbi:nuclear transport factor 2 family protein [Cellvibrio polysaccharolyticus]|nr:nuclear transport factor 2 family protein [Cellvibrio polysaccharolyticus]
MADEDKTFLNEESTVEEEVKTVFRRIYAAMLEADTVALAALLDENFTLTHMTGRLQQKHEWLADITAGRMIYHAVTEVSSTVRIADNVAVLVGRDVVNSTIYGGRGQWNLQLTTEFTKRDGQWMATRMLATTFR